MLNGSKQGIQTTSQSQQHTQIPPSSKTEQRNQFLKTEQDMNTLDSVKHINF